MAFSIREWQKGAISRLLRLGKDLGDGESSGDGSAWSDARGATTEAVMIRRPD